MAAGRWEQDYTSSGGVSNPDGIYIDANGGRHVGVRTTGANRRQGDVEGAQFVDASGSTFWLDVFNDAPAKTNSFLKRATTVLQKAAAAPFLPAITTLLPPELASKVSGGLLSPGQAAKARIAGAAVAGTAAVGALAAGSSLGAGAAAEGSAAASGGGFSFGGLFAGLGSGLKNLLPTAANFALLKKLFPAVPQTGALQADAGGGMLDSLFAPLASLFGGLSPAAAAAINRNNRSKAAAAGQNPDTAVQVLPAGGPSILEILLILLVPFGLIIYLLWKRKKRS